MREDLREIRDSSFLYRTEVGPHALSVRKIINKGVFVVQECGDMCACGCVRYILLLI